MPPQNKYRYDELADEDIPRPALKRGRRISCRDFISFIIVAILSSTITFAATRHYSQAIVVSPVYPVAVNSAVSPAEPTHVVTKCGRSKEDAIAMGCTFDPLATGWLPQNCPRHMTDEFLNYSLTLQSQPWSYWVDQEGTEPIANYDVISGMDWFWTTNGEHLTHCTFLVLRFYTAMNAGEPTNGLTMSTDHARHCLMWLLEIAQTWEHWDTIGSHANVGFEFC